MKIEKLVQHLSDAVRKLGYKVRTEDGNFRGGTCLHEEQRTVFINRRMGQEERAELLARVLVQENTDDVYLLPEVRAYIGKFAEAAARDDGTTD